MGENKGSIQVKIRGRAYRCRRWAPGSGPPLFGQEFGLDTETLRIESRLRSPDLVLLQVCNGEEVDLVGWEHAAEYLDLLDKGSPGALWYMLNAPFDALVLRHPAVYRKLDCGELVDINARHRVYKLSIQGYYDEPGSLANLAKLYCRIALPKPEEIRLTFDRAAPPSDEHLRYAALDAVVTYLIAKNIPMQPTEGEQTRAMFALELISRNGLLVDRPAWDRRKADLEARLAELADQLRLQGFEPDPEALKPREMLRRFCQGLGMPAPASSSYLRMQGMLAVALELAGGIREHALFLEEFKAKAGSFLQPACPPLPAETRAALKQLLDRVGMGELLGEQSTRPYVRALSVLFGLKREGREFSDLLVELGLAYNRHGGWSDASFAGPGAFLQNYLDRLEKSLGVVFPRTPTGKIKMSKDELWRLKELGRQDTFLELYVEYKHAEKLLKTYLSDDNIGPDGRIHPHFDFMVDTGRTSCYSPNMQNLPREGGIRELIAAPPGHALVSVDYAQLELCTLAQHCKTSFGTSRMAEIINAGIDLHSWFGARVMKLLDDKTDYKTGDEDSRRRVIEIIGQVPKEVRQRAKAANFGFPGGMRAKRFLFEAQKHGMVDMTIEEAEKLREAWFQAFPEMAQYMRPTMVPSRKSDPEDPHVYEAHTLTGRSRRYCSYNSALNFSFQALAADGCKVAMWNLIKAGFKLVNFIHDEFLIELRLDDALNRRVELAQEIMCKSMRQLLPDVAVRTEAAAMTRWYKAAGLRDNKGNLVIWTPENQATS